MQIQINSLAALERLIGNDNRLEIDIRNSVVQNFAAKQLKPLLNSPEISKMVRDFKEESKKEAQKNIAAEIGEFKKDGWREYFVISDEVKNKIKDIAGRETRLLIEAAVLEATKVYTEKYIQKEISRRLDYTIAEEIKKGCR